MKLILNSLLYQFKQSTLSPIAQHLQRIILNNTYWAKLSPSACCLQFNTLNENQSPAGTFVLLPEFVVVFDIGQQEFLTNWQSSLRRFSNFSMIFLAGIKHPHILATTGSEKGCW